MEDGPVNTEAQLKRVATPLVIRELQNYKPFSFGHSLLMSRDMYRHEDRAIGVFTSGDDAPGIRAVDTEATVLIFVLNFIACKCIIRSILANC